MVASTMLKGGFSNRTLQYADVSSMTRTCAAISVMIRSPCNEDVHERGTSRGGVHRARRHAMDVRTRVVQVRRPGALDALRLQQCEGQLFRELTVGIGRKEIGGGVDIDHRHAHLTSNRRAIAARRSA